MYNTLTYTEVDGILQMYTSNEVPRYYSLRYFSEHLYNLYFVYCYRKSILLRHYKN